MPDGKETVQRPKIVIGAADLGIEGLAAVAEGRASLALSSDRAFRARLERSVAVVRAALASGQVVYGVTTGFGDSCDVSVAGAAIAELPTNLVRYHGCGVGEPLGATETAAVVVARVASLAKGLSGVRPVVLEHLVALCNAGVLPLIPSLGSVGASGDLTPLSYLAALLMGERTAQRDGRPLPAVSALSDVGLEPLRFEPKESLALMNGTSVMTGLTCLGVWRAWRLARLASALSSMAMDVTLAPPAHLDDRLFAAKPHPGQRRAAAWMRHDLQGTGHAEAGERLQARYSLRCAPHVIGVLLDFLPLARSIMEIELNGAGDNPLIDLDTGDFLHGGNFYGGHACMVADTLKAQVASLADLFDRQLALVGNARTSHGLPDNLVYRRADDASAHHGFKAMQITASALTAEALKLTMPAGSFSRSTENHNQDKVSMGTIAARECLRSLELTELVAMVHLLALCQAVDLRGPERCGHRARALHASVRGVVPRVDADRAMDTDIAVLLGPYRRGELAIGSLDDDA